MLHYLAHEYTVEDAIRFSIEKLNGIGTLATESLIAAKATMSSSRSTPRADMSRSRSIARNSPRPQPMSRTSPHTEK